MPSHCSLMREELQAAHTNTVSLWASGAEEERIIQVQDHKRETASWDVKSKNKMSE